MDKKELSDSQLDCLGSAIRGEGSGLGSQSITKSSMKQSDKKVYDIFIYVRSKSRIYNEYTFLNQMRCAKSRKLITAFEGDDEYAY